MKRITPARRRQPAALLARLAVELYLSLISLSLSSLELEISLSLDVAGDPPAVLRGIPILEFVACPHTFDPFSI
jgi:hypothetical protein